MAVDNFELPFTESGLIAKRQELISLAKRNKPSLATFFAYALSILSVFLLFAYMSYAKLKLDMSEYGVLATSIVGMIVILWTIKKLGLYVHKSNRIVGAYWREFLSLELVSPDRDALIRENLNYLQTPYDDYISKLERLLTLKEAEEIENYLMKI